MLELLKRKTFWAGVALIASVWVPAEWRDQVQATIAGLAVIAVRHAIQTSAGVRAPE